MAASLKVLPSLGQCFLLFLVLLPSIQPRPVKKPFGFIQDLQGIRKGQTIKGLRNLKLYLQNFGYLNYDIQVNNERNHENDDEFDELLESAIKTFQRWHHLKPTGALDVDTVEQMTKPRCGVPDIVNHGNKQQYSNHHGNNKSMIHTVRRYNLFPGEPKWPASINHLRYRFVTDVSEELKPIIARAFQRWASVSRFSFEEVHREAQVFELEIGFHGTQGLYSGDNGFDGRGKVLAHATWPTDGKFHYDQDENWSSNPGPDQMDWESVAVHEIGHLLGLAHTQVTEAVMYAYMNYGITKRNLHQDDIDGIHSLYGTIR